MDDHEIKELEGYGFPNPDFAARAALRWYYAQLSDGDDMPRTIAEHRRIILEEMRKDNAIDVVKLLCSSPASKISVSTNNPTKENP